MAGLVLSAANAAQAGQFNAATNTITFNASNWSTPFTVKVAGSSVPLIQSNEAVTIGATVSSSSVTGVYANAATPPSATFVLSDSRMPVTVSAPVGGLALAPGQSTTYTLQLSKAPIAPVTISLLASSGITLSAANSSDSRFSVVGGTPEVTFTASNWSTPFIVKVTAASGMASAVGQPLYAFTAQPHTLSDIQGPVLVEGDLVANANVSLHPGVMLPTEICAPLPVIATVNDQTTQNNTRRAIRSRWALWCCPISAIFPVCILVRRSRSMSAPRNRPPW